MGSAEGWLLPTKVFKSWCSRPWDLGITGVESSDGLCSILSIRGRKGFIGFIQFHQLGHNLVNGGI